MDDFDAEFPMSEYERDDAEDLDVDDIDEDASYDEDGLEVFEDLEIEDEDVV